MWMSGDELRGHDSTVGELDGLCHGETSPATVVVASGRGVIQVVGGNLQTCDGMVRGNSMSEKEAMQEGHERRYCSATVAK